MYVYTNNCYIHTNLYNVYTTLINAADFILLLKLL